MSFGAAPPARYPRRPPPDRRAIERVSGSACCAAVAVVLQALAHRLGRRLRIEQALVELMRRHRGDHRPCSREAPSRRRDEPPRGAAVLDEDARDVGIPADRAAMVADQPGEGVEDLLRARPSAIGAAGRSPERKARPWSSARNRRSPERARHAAPRARARPGSPPRRSGSRDAPARSRARPRRRRRARGGRASTPPWRGMPGQFSLPQSEPPSM